MEILDPAMETDLRSTAGQARDLNAGNGPHTRAQAWVAQRGDRRVSLFIFRLFLWRVGIAAAQCPVVEITQKTRSHPHVLSYTPCPKAGRHGPPKPVFWPDCIRTDAGRLRSDAANFR